MTWYDVVAQMRSAAMEPAFPWATFILGCLLIVAILFYLFILFKGEDMKQYRGTALMVVILLGALAVGISGCATVKSEIQAAAAPSPATADQVQGMADLQAKVTADLTQAVADAKAAKDVMAPVRLKCWETLLGYVPTLPTVSLPDLGKSAGLFDTIERGAEAVEAVDVLLEYQIPQQVRVDLAVACGPVQTRARDLLAQFNLRLVSVAGKVALLPK